MDSIVSAGGAQATPVAKSIARVRRDEYARGRSVLGRFALLIDCLTWKEKKEKKEKMGG